MDYGGVGVYDRIDMSPCRMFEISIQTYIGIQKKAINIFMRHSQTLMYVSKIEESKGIKLDANHVLY